MAHRRAVGHPDGDGRVTLGARVRRGGGEALDDPHFHADGMKRGGDDPPIAAVIASPRRDDDADTEIIGKSAGDLGGGCGTGALHERPRRDPCRDRRGVGGSGARGVDDAHRGYFCDAPTMRP
jgi:hypothetical protein